MSKVHAEELRKRGLTAAELAAAQAQATQSLLDQQAIETSDEESLDEYVARFQSALKAPHAS